MNILQVSNGLVMRGAEVHILGILQGFRDLPVNMSLVVFTDGPLAEAARKLGVNVYVIRKRFRGDVWPLIALTRLIRAEKIDIVHTHLISGNFYGRVIGKYTKVKGIVSTIHYSDKLALGEFTLPFMGDFLFKLDTAMSRFSDYIVAPSKELQKLLVRKGVNEDKVINIPNAFNCDLTKLVGDSNPLRVELGLAPDIKIVGMVGRLVPVKNFEMFLRAAKIVINSGANVKFLLVGDGPQRPVLERLVQWLGIDEHISFLGFRADVFAVVSMLDVFVLCSKWETFPISLIEAMALGKPVIATDVGGVKEIITKGENGLLVPVDDHVALASAIIHLLTQKESSKKMGRLARHRATTEFGLEIMCDSLLSLYKTLSIG